MNRAYAWVSVTKAADGSRVIEGTATTPRPDRHADSVASEGAEYRLPLPLLLDHNHVEAVGTVEHANVTAKGIRFRARIAKIAEPGAAKDLVDKAWSLVSNGLRAAVSIGFRPLEMEPLATGGLLFKRWEWMELSLVAVPANADATIDTIKRYDREARLKANPARVVKLDRPVGTAMYHATRDPLDPSIAKAGGTGVAMLTNMVTAGAKAADDALAQLDRRLRAVEGGGNRLSDADRRQIAEVARLVEAGNHTAALALIEAGR